MLLSRFSVGFFFKYFSEKLVKLRRVLELLVNYKKFKSTQKSLVLFFFLNWWLGMCL